MIMIKCRIVADIIPSIVTIHSSFLTLTAVLPGSWIYPQSVDLKYPLSKYCPSDYQCSMQVVVTKVLVSLSALYLRGYESSTTQSVDIFRQQPGNTVTVTL